MAPRHKHHLLLPEIGGQGQQKLAGANVLVVGAGGLGCPILSYLAAAGVGSITVCDGDRVELSNLQRQILYTEDDIGDLKAEAAARRLKSLNSEIEVTAITSMIAEDNAQGLVRGRDLVIEGVDRIAARHVINRACLSERVPLLSSAASRFEGQVALFRPGQENAPCYACLVPPEAEEDGLCDRDGVMGPVVGLVGSLAAGEAIKFLCNIEPTLVGQLLIYNGRDGTIRRVAMARDPHCAICGTPQH
ncbi:MAG: HesA/MoeB/ThiF family protein [Pseudomonadota bacterium]